MKKQANKITFILPSIAPYNGASQQNSNDAIIHSIFRLEIKDCSLEMRRF
jgi:hypothetical protein